MRTDSACPLSNNAANAFHRQSVPLGRRRVLRRGRNVLDDEWLISGSCFLEFGVHHTVARRQVLQLIDVFGGAARI
jgi:hypothetical protein